MASPWGQKAVKLSQSLSKLLQGFSAVQTRKEGQGPAAGRGEWRGKDTVGMESCGESPAKLDFYRFFTSGRENTDLKPAGFAGRDPSLLRSPTAAAKKIVCPEL